MPRVPGPVQHGTPYAYSKRGCRCDECKEARRVELFGYRQLRKQRTGRAQKRRTDRTYLSTDREHSKAVCPWCKSEIRGKGDYHKDCRTERTRSLAKRSRLLALVERQAVGATSNWRWVQGDCRACGVSFLRHDTTSYCSTECRDKVGPRRRQFKVSATFRLAIYERDNWTCQLCLEPVDRTLHYLDDWAASLDHIECQAWTLIPDHSETNLRLAHRWCNAVRGDERYYTDADLRARAA